MLGVFWDENGIMLKNKSKAQSAVEFALIVPILVILLAGIIEVAHLIFVYASVFNAAREGARYGAASGEVGSIDRQYQDCVGIRNSALRLRFLADFDADDISVTYDKGPGTASSVQCQDMTTSTWGTVGLGSRIVVTITSTFRMVMPILPVPEFNITSMSARTIIGTVFLPAP